MVTKSSSSSNKACSQHASLKQEASPHLNSSGGDPALLVLLNLLHLSAVGLVD